MRTRTVQEIAKESYNDVEQKELQEILERAIDSWLKKNNVSIDDGKLIIPKNFAIDTSYAVMWSVNDFENIVKKLIGKTNTGHLHLDEYFRYLTRIYNDQSVVLDKNTTLEPLAIGRKRDRINYLGVRDLLLNWLGNYQPPLSHAVVGDGTGLATYGTSALYNQLNIVPINQANSGSIGLRGETLFANASFPSGMGSFTMREAGITTGTLATDKLELYIQFNGADQKGHTVNVTIPQFSMSTNICTI